MAEGKRPRMMTALVAIAILVLGFAATRAFGARRWSDGTLRLRADLGATRTPIVPARADFAQLAALPAPVERFFRNVLTDGQAMIAGVRLRHTGTFNMSETADQWKAFTSDQQVVTDRPGFDWDGRIVMFPGIPVYVHDAYVAGEGLLHASLGGVFTLAYLRGQGDIAQGELMRFMAEAAWYPTVLLPGRSVRWTAVDDRSADATLVDGSVFATLRFTFHADGPIDTVSADARPRTVGATVVPTRWHGRFWNYDTRNGVRVPLDGEVSWLLPDGPKPYWRGHTTDIVFSFVP